MTIKPDQSAFTGATRYVLDEELAQIVNISMALEMPLLLKGEPGTGKTMLAHAIAESLNMPLIVLNVKSSMKLVEALYQYDTLTRLNDSRFGDSRRDVSNIEEYIKMGKIGQAFVADQRTVLLIDEIDKADTDFQDDMLDVLDQMEFDVIEVDQTVKAKNRPVIIITSNAKKDLSDPFLGRCNFHHIAFPEPDMMRQILRVHFPGLDNSMAVSGSMTRPPTHWQVSFSERKSRAASNARRPRLSQSVRAFGLCSPEAAGAEKVCG